ncbi:MAG: hypothetical protein QW767_03810 [Thermoprotei archaeon]
MLSSLSDLQEKTSQLYALIRQENDLTNQEAKKREELNAKFKVLIKEYKELKARREEALKLAKELRDKREAVYQELRALHDSLKGRETELNAVRNIDRQVHRLKQALEESEWEYQTRSMSPSAAKNLEKEIADLEQKLSSAMRKQEAFKETFEIKSKYDQKLSEFRDLKSKFKDTITKLDELRALSAAKLGEAKKVKAEADERHQKYIEHANQVIKLQAELNALRMQLQEARRDSRIRSTSEQREKNNKLILDKMTRAKEKMSKGEKLDFEEWQALLLGEELSQG